MSNTLSTSSRSELSREVAHNLSHESLQNKDQQFLRLSLTPQNVFLLPVQQLIEVLAVPINQVVPIPHMSPEVTGIYNWRGEILWVIDLGHLLELAPWYKQTVSLSTFTLVVLQIGNSKKTTNFTEKKNLGLIVSKVEGIESFGPKSIQPIPSSEISDLTQLLQGYYAKSDNEMLKILDGQAIINAMSKS
jgi:positive phototaxis protein PixI